jgi:hypothetical protein
MISLVPLAGRLIYIIYRIFKEVSIRKTIFFIKKFLFVLLRLVDL